MEIYTMRGLKQQAWVTCALEDEDVSKALVLAKSLKLSATNRSLAVIASPRVSHNLRDALRSVFEYLFILEEDHNVGDLKGEEFVKLFTLSLHAFEKCVYLSPNMMVVQNCDEIFDEMTGSRQRFACLDKMNMSIVLVKPSVSVFRILMKALQAKNGTSTQEFLRKWIKNQNKVPVILTDKYKMHVTLNNPNGDQQLLRNEKDISIVEFDKGFPVDGHQMEKLGMIGKMVVKYWINIYEQEVKPILNSFSQSKLTLAPDVIIADMEHERVIREPIAIVGMSCRYPGSNNLEEFWNLLVNGEDGTGNPPPFRWLKEQCSRNRPDCRKTNAGFLKTPVDEFDAKFFGIRPKEVMFMDPQHRLLHELIWEGLEDAAIDPLGLRGSNSGVFMGSWTNDFRAILDHAGETEFYRTYMGNSIGAAAARISFLLGITGPSVATESGCSSAMVAVHMACRSLQMGETNMALACGVNLLLHPFDKDEMSMVISPDGHCKTFDELANGFARAEGCGVLVLKRLSDAIKDNDHIWGMIRGSGMSQEGVSKSMGTPTVHCEALAMKQALEDAQVDPGEISYVEAHGTGTVVGDPMEVAAIAKAYQSESRTEPLWIGSVKTNVGHTESCSGITGIMKVVLAMHHETIPPHVNFKNLNPNINLDAVPARIPLEPVAWPRITGKPKLSGVSSFGITGTDAHVIIEEPPPPQVQAHPLKNPSEVEERPLHILKLSAKTEEALNGVLQRFQEYLETTEEDIADICYTANVGRADFNMRTALVCKSKEEAAAIIKENRMTRGEVTEGDKGKICFLFTGQGSQYPRMAKQLYETSPVFRMHFEYCSRILQNTYGINIEDVLWSEKNKAEVSRTIYSQTSIFCVEYALLKLWESWGVKPDYVLGHSLGEFAAAVCAGILTPEDAIKLVAERSRLIDDLPRGKMLVIKVDKQTVATGMKKFAGSDPNKIIDYAAINSSQQTVVAGDSEIILEFAAYCSDQLGLKSIVLEATHAFHSKHMDPMLQKYSSVAESVMKVTEFNCEYISGMRGGILEPSEVNAEYWVQHTREKVDFLNASKKAVELGCEIFIEIGPQPVLSALTMMNSDKNILCVPSLKKNEEEWNTLFESLGKLYVKGQEIKWEGLDEFCSRKKVSLPSYPFIGKKFWPDMMAVTGASLHPLLGSLIPNASSTKLFQSGLNLRALEYVKDHLIGNNIIFPGAGYLEMCVCAGQATVEGCTEIFTMPFRPIKVENLSIEAPLCLEESKSCQAQVVVDFNSSTGNGYVDWNDLTVKIFHRVESSANDTLSTKWLQHAHATFTPLPTSEDKEVFFDLERFQSRIMEQSNDSIISEVYDKLAAIGLKFGPTFRSLEKIWKDNDTLLAKVKVPQDFQQYIVHPVVLDAMIQAVMMLHHTDKLKKKLFVPIRIGKFVWLSGIASAEDIYIHASQNTSNTSSAYLIDGFTNHVVAIMSDVEFIDTTVKAIESVLEQQTTTMPDLWEETWREKQGPMQARPIPDSPDEKFYSDEFYSEVISRYNSLDDKRQDTFNQLEEFVYLNTLRGFYECGWVPEVGRQFNTWAFAEELKIKEEFHKFFGFLLTILEAEGILKKVEGQKEWEVCSMPPDYSNIMSQLSSPLFTSDLASRFRPTLLLGKIGESLSEIFQGERSALEVLFPDGQKEYPSVGDFYDDYADYFEALAMIFVVEQEKIRHFMEKRPGDKQVFRIIEIGAGTGLYANIMLPKLEEQGAEYEYTYTDISPAFFPAAEKRFEKYLKNMKFKRLNIEEDPAGQGFVPEYYDMAIASDVIHATKDVKQSLRNVRQLLRDGGNFDIVEQTKVNRIITYTFGLMEGFWRFEDLELRPDHCTITLEKWREAFEATGFEVTAAFPTVNGYHAKICTQRCEVQICPQTSSGRAWILYWNEDSNSHPELCPFLKRKLEENGRQVVVVRSKGDGDGDGGVQNQVGQYFVRGNCKQDFEQLMEGLSSKKVNVEGVVYAWPLERRRQTQEETMEPYFYIAQTLSLLKQKSTPRVVALTSGVAPLPGKDVDLSQFHSSTLWGFTKALKNENVEINCRCVDITDDGGLERRDRMQEVFYEIWSEDKETQVAYHGGSRYIPKLQRHKPQQNALSIPKSLH